MELTQPRPKKFCRISKNAPLPVILKKDGSVKMMNGVFNGFSVYISDPDDMKNVISMGYFGKANLSRNYPQFSDKKTELLRNRQYDRRKIWGEQTRSKEIKKVVVVPDSDEETEDYFTNLKPEFRLDKSGVKETVWLSLEESFFLSETVKCLDIFHDGKVLASEECWKLFSETNPDFQRNYIAYFYFRARNWVVKPGIKFGGDYLLYKEGPPFYHASYVVIIDVLDENLRRIENLSKRSMDNVSVLSLNRLCETAGKELLICQVVLPKNAGIHYKNLGDIKVKEILCKRWMLTQEVS